MHLFLTLSTLLLSSLIAVASSASRPLASDAPPCLSNTEGRICHHAFAGARAPIPGELITPMPCTGLKTQFVQLSTRLRMPLGAERIVNETSCIGLTFHPLLPDAERELVVELQLFYRNAGGTWGKLWSSAPSKVYPTSLLDPLRAWAQQHQLIVKDREGRLTTFLQEHAIPFRTRLLSRRNAAGRKPVYLITGGGNAPHADLASWPTANAHVILFHETVLNLPKITSRMTSHGARINVEMKLLDRLPNDPLAQKAFLDIFRLSQRTDSREDKQ